MTCVVSAALMFLHSELFPFDMFVSVCHFRPSRRSASSLLRLPFALEGYVILISFFLPFPGTDYCEALVNLV